MYPTYPMYTTYPTYTMYPCTLVYTMYRTSTPIRYKRMSASFSACQFNSAFTPKRLCNWETPAVRLKEPVARGPGYRTQTIVSENGHLLPSSPKTMNAFTTGYEAAGPKRWPDAQHSTSAPYGGSTSMGFKSTAISSQPTLVSKEKTEMAPSEELANTNEPRS